MCGIKFWKGSENLRSVYKKPFSETLSSFFHFWPFKFPKRFIVPFSHQNPGSGLNPDSDPYPQHWFRSFPFWPYCFFLQPSVERETSYYLDAGHWFLSLYNDDSDPRQVKDHPCAQKYMNHSVSLLLTHLLYVSCLKVLELGTREVVIFLWAQLFFFPLLKLWSMVERDFDALLCHVIRWRWLCTCQLTWPRRVRAGAPGTVSASRASASAAQDTSDRTALSVSIQCCLGLTLHLASVAPGTASAPRASASAAQGPGYIGQDCALSKYSVLFALPYI